MAAIEYQRIAIVALDGFSDVIRVSLPITDRREGDDEVVGVFSKPLFAQKFAEACNGSKAVNGSLGENVEVKPPNFAVAFYHIHAFATLPKAFSSVPIEFAINSVPESA